MATQRQETFDRLKALIERDDRPANETDNELFAQLRQCDQLRTDQLLHLVTTAIQTYDQAIQRNVLAMRRERQRLQAQIPHLLQELTYNQHRVAQFHRRSPPERRDVLVQMVLQRVKLDEDSAELEEKGV